MDPPPDRLEEQAEAFVRAAKAPSALRAYRSDWEDFRAWAEDRGVPALPATEETVALYLASLAATHRPATLTRRLTSITKAHQANGLTSPASVSHLVVGETLKGIRRTLGTNQSGKAPLLTLDILKLLAHLPPGLHIEQIAWVDEGAVLTLVRSKTDQEGQGRQVAIPRGAHAETCPATALRNWLKQAGIRSGPIFRAVDRHGKVRARALHPDAVGAIVKRALSRAGFDPASFGGHSLRAGFATQAARNGATAFDIMRQTGHRSIAVVSRYVREAQLFRDAPASKLGL